jgi:hypothetical protein
MFLLFVVFGAIVEVHSHAGEGPKVALRQVAPRLLIRLALMGWHHGLYTKFLDVQSTTLRSRGLYARFKFQDELFW